MRLSVFILVGFAAIVSIENHAKAQIIHGASINLATNPPVPVCNIGAMLG